MELSDLRIFQAVVRAGGVTRAAGQLHRVQSNITTRVKQLEEKLGVALFLREGKRLKLTPAGMVLFDYADRLIALAQEAREALLDQTPRGLLRLGAMESTAAVRLPAPLSDYHRRYPEVTLELQSGNPQQLSARVLAGELEAALITEPVPDGPFESLALYDEEMVIVAARGTPRIASARNLTNRTVLVFEPGCPHRKRLEDWFARGRQLPQRIVEISSYHALLGCAAAGMGVALLPRSVVDAFPGSASVSIHPLAGAHGTARTMMIWRKGFSSPKVRALADALLAAGQKRARDPAGSRRAASRRSSP
jgi:DNA-binding transcriptional LysR family regulator